MTAITIDGPSGAGKSTIAMKLAEKIGYNYLDTGAMYRYITFYLQQKNIDLFNKELICETILNEDKLIDEVINLDSENNPYIRSKSVTKNVSLVSSYPCVREFLVELQRQISKKSNIVMDGRDIGSVVLPDAEYKFYLTASEEERARRRYLQYVDSNTQSFEEVLQDIIQRDQYDMNRSISPLVIPNNATIIDSTELSIDDVVNKMLAVIKGENNAL